jgi:hypothetical protein
MSSKTLKLIRQYHRILKEQGEDLNVYPTMDPNAGQQAPPDAPQSVVDNPEPPPEDTMPLSSKGENDYISYLIDAALFEPSPEEANELSNLRSVMDLKRFKNAREEIKPKVLGIINPSTTDHILKKALNKVD